MSTIWTPSGEHRPEPGPSGPEQAKPEPSGPEQPGPEQANMEAQLREARAELGAVPVADIVANHAIGLWQLAVLHLAPDPEPDGRPVAPRLAEAGLAIDAFAALVEGLGDRLGAHADTLREALAQLRLAYVELGSTGPG